MVGGGFLGRKCAGVKNEIVVGRHPVGPWWKGWIIIWMLWVMEVCVPFRQSSAEQQGVAGKAVCAPLGAQEQNSPRLLCKHRGSWNYLLEFILINFTYIETSVMSRKGSFEERKIIFVSGSVDLKYCTRLGSMMPGSGGGFSARVMLLPKWGCGNSHNWKQSGSFNSWEKESNPHNPLYCLICFLSGHVKGPWNDQSFNLGTLGKHLKLEGMSLGPELQITPLTAT